MLHVPALSTLLPLAAAEEFNISQQMGKIVAVIGIAILIIWLVQKSRSGNQKK